MVFAKSETAKKDLQDQFAQQLVHRHYVALVEGQTTSGQSDHYLIEDKNLRVYVAEKKTKQSKRPSHLGTYLHMVNHQPFLASSRLDADIKSVCLAENGNPVVGDKMHGASTNLHGRVCLHAVALNFFIQRPVFLWFWVRIQSCLEAGLKNMTSRKIIHMGINQDWITVLGHNTTIPDIDVQLPEANLLWFQGFQARKIKSCLWYTLCRGAAKVCRSLSSMLGNSSVKWKGWLWWNRKATISSIKNRVTQSPFQRLTTVTEIKTISNSLGKNWQTPCPECGKKCS